MQVIGRAAIALALALPLAAPVSAQAYRWDANVNGGYTWLGSALDSDRLFFDNDIFDGEIFDDELLNDFGDLKFKNRGIVGGQVGYWFSKNVGLRGNFAWTRSPLRQGNLDLIDHVNLPSLTGDLLVRLVKPRDRFTRTEFLPYIAGGLGATWVRPSGAIEFFAIDDDDIDIIDGDIVDFASREGRRGVPIVCTFGACATPGMAGFPILVGDTFPVGTRAFFFRRATPFTGLLAVGTDIRFAKQFAVRLEVGDRIWEAPIDEILPTEFEDIFLRTNSIGKTVNQFYATIGANFLWGLEAPPKRVVVAPPPRPAPPPPPATEDVTVCVIDPTYAQGLRMITATRNLSTNDTTVMKNGQKVPLSEAVANVPVAGNASWYVSGAPLEIGMAPHRLQYASVGGARHIEAGDLAYIGTLNGVPVFADRLSLTPGLTNLGPNTDLNRLVMESEDARKALDSVQVIYVPLQPTGCVFQALQKQVEVKKK